MSSKLEKAVLIGSLGFCFTQSMNEQESVNYITEKHGDIFKEDLIKHVFDVMSKTKKLNPGESNMISILEKEILMDELGLCFKQNMTKEECVSYLAKKHCGLFDEDVIKRVFGIMSKMKKLEAVSDILIRSLKWCFDQYFTKQEILNYIKEKHAELYEEDKIKGLYAHLKNKYPYYQAEADSRCSLRKLMTQDGEWSTEDKMKVIQGRLSPLSQSTRALLGNFSQWELETMGYFITKDFFPEDLEQPYALSGIHAKCFHCHCMECYYSFSADLEKKEFSAENRKVVEEVWREIDVAEEKNQQDDDEVTKGKSGGKKTGKKKGGRGKK